MGAGQPWRILLFGGLRLEQGGSVVTRFRSQKAAALLGYLALYHQRSHTREALADLLWPDADSLAGRTNLRTALASLRRQLEPPGVPAGSVLRTPGHSDVSLNPAAFVLDVVEFEQGLRAASQAGAPEERARHLAQSVALYTGPLMPGCYDTWALTERERLAEANCRALRDLARLYEAAGDFPRALDCARRAVTTDPLSEEAQAEVLRLLVASGEHIAARRHYEEMERLFERELGAAPADETRALLHAPIPNRVSAKAAAPSPIPMPGAPTPVEPSAGEASTAPQESTVHLPLTMTRFFGREAEMAYLERTLHDTRLLTVTGPGGGGKTRLVIETARTLGAHFTGSLWFISLSEVWVPERFFDTIAGALRLPRTRGADPQTQVTEALCQLARSGPILLILDNFEQLAERAAVHVQALLAAVPALSCLVTSRQRLMLDGECEYALQPLTTPEQPRSPERLAEYPSVQLFVSRAQAVRPDFQITPHNAADIGELCRRLEGLPLALELAAAWAQTLTPSQFLSRLGRRFDLLIARRRDAPGRHATMRATIEWSYQLLSPPLQRFFAGLSVFTGGWTLEAAEDVLEEPRALVYLAELNDQSLIFSVEEPESDVAGLRFRMLETLREFAAEQVTAEERERLRRRHFRYCLRFAEEAGQRGDVRDQVTRLNLLEREQPNMRVALEDSLRAEDEGRRREGLRLAALLGGFWFLRGIHREGREWLRLALDVDGDTESRILVLNMYALILYYQKDYAAAYAAAQESLDLADRIGREDHAVFALSVMGTVRINEPSPADNATSSLHADMAEIAAEALRRGEASGEPAMMAYGLFIQALALAFAGDLANAESAVQRSIALFASLGDLWMGANARIVQGLIGLFQDDLAMASEGFVGAAELSQPLEYGGGLFWVLHGMASIAARRGAAERATILFGAADQYGALTQMVLPAAYQPMRDRDIAAIRAALGAEARFTSAWDAGKALPLKQALDLALSPVSGSQTWA